MSDTMQMMTLFEVVTPELTVSEQAELQQYEQTIERGLNTFVEVGGALLAIRKGRLYRAQYGTFEDYCRERWGFTDRRARQIIESAEVVINLETGNIFPVLPNNERQANALHVLPVEQQVEAWKRAVEISEGKPTAAIVQRAVDEVTGRLVHGAAGDYIEGNNGVKQCKTCGELWAADLPYCPYCHISPEARIAYLREQEKRPVSYHVSDDSYDWYTPPEYIEAARGVMGGIDLDPASSQQANEVIKADCYYTKDDDGLAHDWRGRVWLNPPYNMPLIEQFIDKVIDGYKRGDIECAVVLTNNSTDTAWFHKLIDYPVCFTKGRIQFWNGDERLATRQGQALFYLGGNPDLFAKVFSAFGVVLRRYDD